MNVFILIGLIMSCFGIAIIIITACILTLMNDEIRFKLKKAIKGV